MIAMAARVINVILVKGRADGLESLTGDYLHMRPPFRELEKYLDATNDQKGEKPRIMLANVETPCFFFFIFSRSRNFHYSSG